MRYFMQTAIVTVPKAALYESAQADSVCDELLSGWVVDIRQSWGNFQEITTRYGYSGWVNASALRPLPLVECCFWEGENSLPSALIQHGMIDVLECPSVQAKALTTLFMGSTVLPLEEPKDGWQKIQMADGRYGYVPACALMPPPGSPPQFESPCPLSEQPKLPETLRPAILGYAHSFLGTPYRWGGKTKEGIDCSGLTFMSYYMCGILIYRDASLVEGYPVHAIPLSKIQPADLLYFPSHIALYLGNGKYIHSTGHMDDFRCRINSLNPKDADYRADLAGCLKGAGSVF